MAAKCCVEPNVMLGLLGVTVKDTRVAGVTVIIVEPDTLPDVAVIVVEPVVNEVATPLEPAALLIVIILVDDALHVTAFVKSCVVLSE